MMIGLLSHSLGGLGFTLLEKHVGEGGIITNLFGFAKVDSPLWVTGSDG